MNYETLGFTGTRNGMSPQQMANFRQMVATCRPRRFRHGACKGSDEQAVVLVKTEFPEVEIHAHPGVSARGGVNEDLSELALKHSHVIHPTDTHFNRNRTIVRLSDAVGAISPCMPLPERGGTVFTINETRKLAKPLAIFFPAGQTAWENIKRST